MQPKLIPFLDILRDPFLPNPYHWALNIFFAWYTIVKPQWSHAATFFFLCSSQQITQKIICWN